MTVLRSDLSKKNLRCLLFEDNPGDVDLIKSYLAEAPGINVALEVCSKLGDAASVDQSTIDFVLLDLNLPDSIGVDTLRTARLLFPSYPIILLTGDDLPEMVSQAFQEGAQDYLVKGTFTPRELSRSILHALERHAQDNRADPEIKLGSDPVDLESSVEQTASDESSVVILVVEDENDLRALNCEFLKVKGYTVLEAEDSDVALEVWNREKGVITVLLTDYLLPGSHTGKQLAEAFSAEKPGLKVLITSGTPSGMARMKSDGGPDFEFLQKPYSMPDLVNTIEECLK